VRELGVVCCRLHVGVGVQGGRRVTVCRTRKWRNERFMCCYLHVVLSDQMFCRGGGGGRGSEGRGKGKGFVSTRATVSLSRTVLCGATAGL
jgi:hypothetical protein